ncbi:hypothetical protein GFK26_18180 [Variovorax paradoxus]|uniref:Uncharacterized protein n=1 Tax=Variovorax paradoxus TaxID=34073 RepID=A0A5Q0M6X5_VARPD|nr:hypothetical protein [Variovorax paradoxus]QFZ84557.1 hypothetical protein GFK26_18180 [Variovorax paradoxus]
MLTEKIKVTPQQRANALEALNVMWPSVPPENVFPALRDWRGAGEEFAVPPSCGTLACFGGWAEWWPEFRRQAGLAPDTGTMTWGDVVELFGPPRHSQMDILPAMRGGHPADEGFTGTDHELVSNRLRWIIQNSEVAG